MLKNRFLKQHDLWFHVCSLGEASSLEPIAKHFKNLSLSITTTTQTGWNRAKKIVEDVRFLPFEIWLPFWVRKQKVLVVLEAELWYMLFFIAKAKGTHTVLLNARISDRSFAKYQKMTWFYKRLFTYVDKVFCQSIIDKERLELLGAKNVEVIGNIKLAASFKATKTLAKPKREMVVAASTHEGEEALILEAFEFTQKETLVVVPRHPERFEAVDILLEAFAKDKKLSYHKFSGQADFESDIVLVDCLGELINIYAISDVVILGGGFAPIGGHNPLEPAAFANKIISGPHHFNQNALFPLVESLKIVEEADLKELLKTRDTLSVASIRGSVDMNPFYNYIEKQIKG